MQDMAIAQLDATGREFNIDPSRVYLSGFSLGAYGVYRFAYRWPDRFAGLVAIAGAAPTIPTYPPDVQELDRRANMFVGAPDPPKAVAERIKHLPIWIFHGVLDKTPPVERARQVVSALKALGTNVRYTEYADADHVESARRAYADPEMIKWLLAQRRH